MIIRPNLNTEHKIKLLLLFGTKMKPSDIYKLKKKDLQNNKIELSFKKELQKFRNSLYFELLRDDDLLFPDE